MAAVRGHRLPTPKDRRPPPVNEPRKTLIQAAPRPVADKKTPWPPAAWSNFVGFAFPVLTMPLTVWFLFENRNIHEAYGMTWPKLFRLTLPDVPQHDRGVHRHLLPGPPRHADQAARDPARDRGRGRRVRLLPRRLHRQPLAHLPGRRPSSSSSTTRSRACPPATPTTASPTPHGRRLPEGPARRGAAPTSSGSAPSRSASSARAGSPSRCPSHTEPIVLCFLDVDFQMSIHQCLVHLWPHLTERGYLFTDDFPILDLCAVFYSEEFWRREFDSHAARADRRRHRSGHGPVLDGARSPSWAATSPTRCRRRRASATPARTSPATGATCPRRRPSTRAGTPPPSRRPARRSAPPRWPR